MINNLILQVHGGGAGGGIAAAVSSLLEFLEGLSGKTPPEMFTTIMPGITAMENIHPVLVHFPIAFLMAFFLVDCIGTIGKKREWRYVAAWLLYLGTFAAIITVIAGLFAADSVEHGDNVHDIMERHEKIGIAILSLSLFLSAWRLKQWGLHSLGTNTVFLCVSAFLCFLLLLGADLGGLMVYQYGVAVKSATISQSAPDQNGVSGVNTELQHHTEHNHEDGHQHSHDHGGHHHTH